MHRGEKIAELTTTNSTLWRWFEFPSQINALPGNFGTKFADLHVRAKAAYLYSEVGGMISMSLCLVTALTPIRRLLVPGGPPVLCRCGRNEAPGGYPLTTHP